jgi:hypothetical protein
MAGTVTTTPANLRAYDGGRNPGITKHAIAWVSDASGNATGDTPVIYGTIFRVAFVPSASAAPTDNYDVTLIDENGIDILSGQGANQDTSTASHVAPLIPATDGTTTTAVPPTVADALSLSVSNAGNAKQGSVVLYVRE